jgi:two-component system chemotaxis response regulator CheY
VKILIADDDPTSRLIADMAVRNLGHECQSVADGTQAWDAFRANDPDVVISDWMMPGQTGLQLCRNIRDQKSGSYTYFIMVTSNGELGQMAEGMSAGADDYLVKPLNHEDLQGRLISAARVTAMHEKLAHEQVELRGLNTELAAIARRDPLTGLANRRALQEDLEVLEARVTRYGHRYCMAVLDVDHFKAYNDSCGHQAGDQILKTIAGTLSNQVRTGDSVYRYGGEEFLCIFPEQSLATGTQAVERMRIGLEQLAIPHPGSPSGVLTLSAGLAMLQPDDIRSASEVLEEADVALYRAKHLGRNRVEYGISEAT